MTNPTAQPDAPASTDIAYLPSEHWPTFADHEIDAVVNVLRSGRVNQWTGDRVRAFETAYDAHLGHGRRSIAVANGSVSLELALRAFGVGPGDEVITTPRTFVASAFVIMLCGATPVFVDVDRDSGNITPETIEAAITPRTRGVIPVHLAGWPCDMPGITRVAEQHGLFVIEDCAQSHGALVDGRPAGSFGDAGSFSFCQDKVMTTGGEGGLIAFRDEPAYTWAWSFKDHGKNRAKMEDPDAPPGFRWVCDMPGTNWRMLETSAVIGLEQLERLAETRAVRTRNAQVWADALSTVDGIRIPEVPPHITHANYKWYCYVDAGAGARDEIMRRCTEAGIRAFSGSCSEVYREQAFEHMQVEPLPVARELGGTSLMFEVHPTLDPGRLVARATRAADIARDVLNA